MAGRILIVDDVATNRIVMKVKLSAARYDVVCAASGPEALTLAQEGGIDLVIMDMMMPAMTGAEACAALRAAPATAAIPVVLVTAGNDAEARMEGLAAGADDFLMKPVDDIALLARVRSLMRTREEERSFEAQSDVLMGAGPGGFAERPAQAAFDARPPRSGVRIALISGGDTGVMLRQREALRPLFGEGVGLVGRDAALALEAGGAPDLFVIEADLGLRNAGLRLMSDLRSRQATRHAATIVVLPSGDSERAATALDLGAADVVYSPLDSAELAIRIRTQLARKMRADRMRDTLETGLRMAVIDPLTGLRNRRYGLRHLDRVAARCRAHGLRAGIVLIDVDHFKAVNDTHGHQAGDRVLSTVAEVLRTRLRGEDEIFRIGGEEFLAVLPGSDGAQATRVAERLRAAVAAAEIALEDGTRVAVTVSLGVGTIDARADASSRALAVADRALYAAKAAGRNRVVLDPGA
jgi:two-component system cell cycle response regulator